MDFIEIEDDEVMIVEQPSNKNYLQDTSDILMTMSTAVSTQPNYSSLPKRPPTQPPLIFKKPIVDNQPHSLLPVTSSTDSVKQEFIDIIDTTIQMLQKAK